VADTVIAATNHAQRLRGVTGHLPDIPTFPESPARMVQGKALPVTTAVR
jgi:hypothetical protein